MKVKGFNEVLVDKKKVKQLFVRLVNISDFVEHYGPMVKCPFHMDSTPSAKLHEDEDKVVRLFCHACRKQFTSYEYVTLIMDQNPIAYLKGKFSDIQLDERARSMEFTEYKRAAIDCKTQLDQFRKDGDLTKLLKSVYKI